MALENRLELKLLQKLILTPQLQQAIKLLQMPQLELEQTLTNELIENPLLEETTEEFADELSPEEIEMAEIPTEAETEEKEIDFESAMPSSVDDYFEERGLDGRDLGYFTPGYVAPTQVEVSAPRESELSEHLLWQLRFSSASEEIKAVAEAVIGNIDESGYLRATTEEIASLTGVSPQLAEKAIALVQSFDPPGVGARDIKECLLIQIYMHGLKGSLAESIIMNNLDDLEKKRYKHIAQQYERPLEEVMHAVRAIESLEPKPGRNFSGSPSIFIMPDVYVVKSGDDYQIILNDENIPNLRINNQYRKLLLNKNSLSKEERTYLEEKLRSAVWLLRSLDHRYKTIYRVSESIVKFQREFFDKGVSYLKPMNLKDISGDLGMHESTISRATANKYLSCSHGLFPFRFFFSSGLNSDSGMVSSTSVKETIKKIISEEDPRKPLSDQKIVEILKKQNIVVARRTIAKYREEMNIPPQLQRKKYE